MDGHYVYMNHLNLLDSQRPRPELHPEIPIVSWVVHTPLCLRQWAIELSDHPDSAFANYILNGIHKGFHIGFDRRLRLESSSTNLNCENPSKVTEYLAREVALHRMWKYPVDAPIRGVHLSPLGLIPKKNKPGKWRMIVDISSPKDSSINDGISTELASLQYTSIDDLAAFSREEPLFSEGRHKRSVQDDPSSSRRSAPVRGQVEWSNLYRQGPALWPLL